MVPKKYSDVGQMQRMIQKDRMDPRAPRLRTVTVVRMNRRGKNPN